MLDDLLAVIKTLQTRISEHSATLRENETRTRMALVDPLLQVLGWDTADPSLVTPEYNVASRAADYALLQGDGRPAATIEAKKLGEPLEAHRMQMLNYSNVAGVQYAGLTDGNRWELYEVFKQAPLDDRRILNVSIANDPPHQTALQLLLLWHPNLASGEPVQANVSVITQENITDGNKENEPTEPPTEPPEGWISLAEFYPKSRERFPSEIRFPDAETRSVPYQRRLLIGVAEFLVRNGKLTADSCPVPIGPRQYIVNVRPEHRNNQFHARHQLTNGLFLETNFAAPQTARWARDLLKHFHQDPSQIYLKLDQ